MDFRFWISDWGRGLVGEPPDSLVGTIRTDERWNPQYPHVLERVDYILEGGPYYHISGCFVDTDVKKGIIVLGGLLFRIVDFFPARDLYLVRLDGGMAIAGHWLRRLTKKFDLVYRRLILTAAVWNLATYREGHILSWRDLKWFKRSKDV